MDLSEVGDLRDCCESFTSENHLSGCSRMIALDNSFLQDVSRRDDSLRNHSATALRKKVILEGPIVYTHDRPPININGFDNSHLTSE